jgi:hypothetical protein
MEALYDVESCHAADKHQKTTNRGTFFELQPSAYPEA